MKYAAHTLLLAVAFIISIEARADTLHAILIGDSTDPALKRAIKENLKNMKRLVAEVGATGAIKISQREVSGEGFRCAAIVQAVEQSSVGNDDAVLFYYSGHGFRRTGSQFPEFDCVREAQDKRVSVDDIVKVIETKKKPRLLIAVADACNRVKSFDPAPWYAETMRDAIPEDQARWQAAVLQLFRAYSGTLILSAAKAGEDAYYREFNPLPRERVGGYFTNQLLQTITLIGKKGRLASWEDIEALAKRPIFIEGGVRQNPTTAMRDLKFN